MSPRIVVAGGSIAGLSAGLTLERAGFEVSIFERSTGVMQSRGAGLVVQPSLKQMLRANGAGPLAITRCTYRRYLSFDGGPGEHQLMPQEFTSWDAIYHTLKMALPSGRYVSGAPIVAAQAERGGVLVEIEDRPSIQADVLVVAEGAQSATRARLMPELRHHYAGYVAWRGTLDEDATDPDLVSFFDDNFTFSDARSGGHALAYMIPGADLATRPGRRRINWVWYVAIPPEDLQLALVDRDGVQHRASLPRGKTPDRIVAGLIERAGRELHPRFAELVAATVDPFLQTIVDVDPPHTVFGRTVLIGDAAFVVRPHTAGGAGKAASEALELTAALRQAGPDIDRGLRAFEQGQIVYGRELLDYGIRLGQGWTRARTSNVL